MTDVIASFGCILDAVIPKRIWSRTISDECLSSDANDNDEEVEGEEVDGSEVDDGEREGNEKAGKEVDGETDIVDLSKEVGILVVFNVLPLDVGGV